MIVYAYKPAHELDVVDGPRSISSQAIPHSKHLDEGVDMLRGKTIIVTGANSGIGKATAAELLRRQGRVIMACRDRERAEKAAQEIQQEAGPEQGELVIKLLDLASLKSVRIFCEEIMKVLHQTKHRAFVSLFRYLERSSKYRACVARLNCFQLRTSAQQYAKQLCANVTRFYVIRCVRLEARLQTAMNESNRLQSGAELKTDTSSRTLSAPVSDAHAVFAYSITDKVNKMQYLSNTQTFQKRFHEQQKHFL